VVVIGGAPRGAAQVMQWVCHPPVVRERLDADCWDPDGSQRQRG